MSSGSSRGSALGRRRVASAVSAGPTVSAQNSPPRASFSKTARTARRPGGGRIEHGRHRSSPAGGDRWVPAYPGRAAARAMMNCGLDDLRLVRPRDGWPSDKTIAAASGADALLAKARLYPDIPAAIADLVHGYAADARDS